ncbi:gibberellin 2-beta-dioxygenase 8-like isoform X1 [Zingiber officinale]|uniref:gibberellin 2-beta-dioxygenase 8-like isoform X1 n=1 Tax=Zingiber officinale TaxID=94328 RepID=UPI001C4D0716|nr:gibberellin 2-beta-dioxygenase 8-like isoform X1 [Zingiber officinale]
MASPEKDQAPVHPPPPPDPELVSYPPFFLQCNAGVGGAPPPPPLPPRAISSFDVVAIDLQRLDAASLGEACRQWGLFRLVNHGIPTALKAEIEAEARRLLSLPFDAKAARFACPSIAYFWGTPAMNLPLKKLNWVEGLHIPLANLRSDRSAVDFDGFETFRNLVDEYGRHMARIARTLFDAIAVDLNLDRTMLSSYLLEDDGTFRIYRYPKCTNANDYLAMEAHTDSSILSIVNQDEVGGLQIWQNDGWFNIEPISNTLVINLGDLMQAISNDEYMSVEHRVSVNESKARVSLCYFGFPTDSCSISSAKYRKFTYKEFKMQMQEDIKAFGSKVGLKRFKIDAQNA